MYWDDLVSQGNGVRYGVIGTAPNRVYVVYWDSDTFAGDHNTDFALQLHEGSSAIRATYFNMAPDASGQSATIGYQGAGGSSATAYAISCNARIIDDNADDSDASEQGWSIAPIR